MHFAQCLPAEGNAYALNQRMVVVGQHAPSYQALATGVKSLNQVALESRHPRSRTAEERRVLKTRGADVMPVFLEAVRRAMPRLAAKLALA